MLTISKEVLLLVLDHDTTERLNAELPGHAVDTALGGALLMDPALNDRIDTDVENLVVVNAAFQLRQNLYLWLSMSVQK